MEPISTKRALANAYIELGKTKPLNKVTVREIAAYCNVSTVTFYNHFEDKYALVSWICNSAVDRHLERLADENEQFDYYDVVVASAHGVAKNAEFYRNAYLNIHGHDSLVRTIANHAANAYLEYLHKSGRVEVLTPQLEFTVRYHYHANVDALFDWLMDGMKEPPETIAQWIVDAMPQSLYEAYFSSAK